MSHGNDPQKAFPEEVLDLRKKGVPFPTWFSGPLYQGNGSSAAVKAVTDRRKDANAPIQPSPPNGGGIHNERSNSMATVAQSEQRDLALSTANRVRIDRARLKDEIRAGRVLVSGVLLYPPDCVGTMRVADLLGAVPHWGPIKVGALLKRCCLSPAKTVGSMSERQRLEVVSFIEGRS